MQNLEKEVVFMTAVLTDAQRESFYRKFNNSHGVTNLSPDYVLANSAYSGECMDIPYLYMLGEKGSGNREMDLVAISQGGAFTRVPAHDESYGLKEEISLGPATGISFPLNDASVRAYERLLAEKRIPFDEFLEAVGYIVNNSMRFAPNNSTAQKALDIAGDSYKPSGNEIMEGTCNTSGAMIRELIHSLNPQGVFYAEISPCIRSIFHDSTAVFVPGDSGVRNWGIINSKSPRLAYNFVPKEALDLYCRKR